MKSIFLQRLWTAVALFKTCSQKQLIRWETIVIAVAGVLLNSSAVAQSIYYIDYNAGSDANNGLSTNAPWKNHPYMASFTGSYSHSATNDSFIFRGGTTWPGTCFPLDATDGGASSNAPDYYGTNASWFAGSSFTKPVWDCSGFPIDNMYAHIMVFLEYGNACIDSIVLTNLNWIANNNNYGVYCGSAGGAVLTNVEFRNWYPTGGAYTSNLDELRLNGGGTSEGTNAFQRVSHCIFDGRPANSHTAYGAFGQITDNNTYCYMAQGIVGNCQFCSNNTFFNIELSIDVTAHQNVIEIFLQPNATNYIHNNIITNCSKGELMDEGPMSLTGGQTCCVYIYNNLVANNTTMDGSCLNLDPSGSNGTNGSAYVFNNTFQSSIGLAFIRVVGTRAPNYYASVTAENNFFIGEGNVGLLPDAGGVPQTIQISSFNLVTSNTAANAAGYTLANGYQPASSTSPTVGTGTNLTALNIFSADLIGNPFPPVSPWDVGAYETSSGFNGGVGVIASGMSRNSVSGSSSGGSGGSGGGSSAAAFAALVPGAGGSDVTNGLLLQYTFNQTRGTTVSDSSGNNQTGSLTGKACWTNGLAGTAALSLPNNDGAFASSDGISSSSLVYSGDWTMTFWIWNNSFPGAANYAASTAAGTGLSVGPSSWGFYDGTTLLKGSSALGLNGWYFLAVSKSSGTQYQLYLNGSADSAGVLANINLLGLVVGNRGGSFLGMNGSLEDFRIFNRVLSSAEVSTLARNGPNNTVATLLLAPPTNLRIVSAGP